MFGQTIRWVLTGAAILLLAAPGAARAEEQPSSKPDESSAAEAKKPSLAEVTRVSTEAAVASVAREQARSDDESKEAAAEDLSATDETAAVVELKPRAKSSDDAKDAVKTDSEGSGRSPVKDVHGSVQGATDAEGSRGRRVGGSVGATTRGGRSSIYVEGQKTRETPPRPQ